MLRRFWVVPLIVLPLVASAGNPGERFLGRLPVTYCVYAIRGGVNEAGQEISLTAKDINNRGQVVGTTGVAGTGQAYVWHRGRGIRLLGVLPGLINSSASAINDAGVVVGGSFNDGRTTLSFIWDAKRGLRLLDASLGYGNHFARDINRIGQVTGGSQLTRTVSHAFRRDPNGDVLDLGTLDTAGGDALGTGVAINDFGTVVGLSSAFEPRLTEGFIWNESDGMQPLTGPALPRHINLPRDINNRGEVVGATEVFPFRAFLWTAAGGRVDLGSLSGVDDDYAEAFNINEWSTVVGASMTVAKVVHAFIWRRQHGMKDLNLMLDETSELASHVVINSANAINEREWIVADGNDLRQPAGGSHAYLLVPRWRAGVPRCK